MASKDKTIILITGGNSGVGYETIKALLQSTLSYHVMLGARSLQKGLDAAAALQADVSKSPSSVE
jgi:NADP-dependent 3-hydroxy acid dehydrogenase YdfG